MKLSVSTWAYFDKSREEAFERIAALGVEGVEIIAHAPCFHVDVNMTDEQIGYVKGLLTAHHLEISAISPATEFLVFTEEEMKAQLDHMKRVADLCLRLGANHARIFAGGRLPEGRSTKECLDAVIYGLQETAKIAESAGIKVSVENHGQFGGVYELFKPAMDAVPSLGITLHTNRLARMPNYLDYVREFAPRVMHTHLNDSAPVTAEGERPRSVALGEGTLDVPAILKILQEAGYSGYYNIEYGAGQEDPTPLIEKSLAYLRKHLA
ncbi:MAG: sugar phosphate isomerase/epimerase [Chloroflexi bacterium]|nr:sugar phosphate isomerase/epimerase [Chloroflexota bacterium]